MTLFLKQLKNQSNSVIKVGRKLRSDASLPSLSATQGLHREASAAARGPGEEGGPLTPRGRNTNAPETLDSFQVLLLSLLNQHIHVTQLRLLGPLGSRNAHRIAEGSFLF